MAPEDLHIGQKGTSGVFVVLNPLHKKGTGLGRCPQLSTMACMRFELDGHPKRHTAKALIDSLRGARSFSQIGFSISASASSFRLLGHQAVFVRFYPGWLNGNPGYQWLAWKH